MNSFCWTMCLTVEIGMAGMWYLSKHFLCSAIILLSIHKNEKNHKNSAPPKIKFHIIFINFFFSMMDTKFSAIRESGGYVWVCCGRGLCIFVRVTILFHQCNNTNITYEQFYSYLRWYFTHCKYCYLTMCVSFPLKNCSLAIKNASSQTVFAQGGRNKYHFVWNWIA